MTFKRAFVIITCLTAVLVNAFDIRLGERRTIKQAGEEIQAKEAFFLQKRDDTNPLLLFPEHNLSVPIDHFPDQAKYEPHTQDEFPLRYWFDASYYKPGGPVIVLQGGETDARERVRHLQKGIVYQLSKATNGIGVILEHRYYGTSIPTSDFSTKNLRFLTTDQALADAAYFAQNIKFPGLEDLGDLTSKTTAYISYGGSYAGAYSALLRVQYPDVYWGVFSSSGVTKAIYDYWAYFKPIMENGPPRCVAAQQQLVHIMDNIWLNRTETDLPMQLKTTFGFGGVTSDQDVAEILTTGMPKWQSLNWDPAVSSPGFYEYCDNITSTKLLYPENYHRRSNVSRLIKGGGYKADLHLENQMLNMIGYFNVTTLSACKADDETQDHCFAMSNATFFQLDSLAEGSWRSWPYQYCTEWGYLLTGNTPAGVLPLTSRTIDVRYLSGVCREAFNVTDPPNTEIINQYGGYDISYPRLAIIDGEWDPWKEATPHAYDFGANPRNSTSSEPFILIPKAVHHWDENGLFPNQTTSQMPPKAISGTQKLMAEALQEWMKDYAAHRTVADRYKDEM